MLSEVFLLSEKFLGGARCFSSPFAGALTPRLAAALGPECLLWFLIAVEQVCSCSKTVVNKLEQAGFEEIRALVASVKEEGLQRLLETVTVTHCVTKDSIAMCHSSLSCKMGIIMHHGDTMGLNLHLCDPWMEGASNRTSSHRIRL